MISVCIPTYNGAKFIREQMESILIQLSEEDEIVISDDSSTDNTIEILESFEDNRIKIYYNNTFQSPVFNLENALVHSRGDVIFTADQDDIWLPGKTVMVLEMLCKFDVVVTDCKVVDEDLHVISDSFFSDIGSRTGFFKNLWRNSYLGCCIAFNRYVLNAVLPFPTKIPMHDIWIGAISETMFRPVFLNQQLLLYRRHGSNTSSASEKSSNTLIEKVAFRMNILLPLIERLIRNFTKGIHCS